ncbi:MAG: putative Ig domain-containing protein [Verrucomicrobia bacterium]|nr:putative Ig domain-containing protein [Verrucomicrobiota bacterium]
MNPVSALRHRLAACLPSSRAARPLAAVSAAFLLAVRLAATPQGVSIGDLVVADAGASSLNAALIQVAPATGTKTTLSGSGATMDTPRIIAPASTTAVYYYEAADATNAGKIVLFNPSTGVRSVIPGSAFTAVTDMAWNSLTSRLLVADAGTSSATAVIYSVDPSTGTRTTITGNGTGSGASLDIPRHLTCSPTGTIYYSESQDATNAGKLVSVVPATGVRTVVAGSAFSAISALNWDAVNSRLIVTDAGTSASNATIYGVDPSTGARTTLTGNGTGSGASLDTPRYAATSSTGAIYYYESADATNAGKVVSVTPATGARTALASSAYTAFSALSVVPSSLPSPSALGSAASVTIADTLSYTLPAGNNRLLVVTASHPDNGGVALTSVTFGTQAMTQAVLSTDGSAAIDSIWILPMGSSGAPTTATITVTRNAGASTRLCAFISAQAFKDANQSSPIQTVSAANVSGGTGNSTLTITSSATDTLFDLFDAFSSSNSLTATAGSNQTAISNSAVYELKNAGVANYAGYGLWKTSTKAGTGATTNTSWTSNDSAYLSAAISIKQAPAVSSPTITSPTKTAITGTTATLGANVTADGGSAITKRGVLYAPSSTNTNPTVGGTGVLEVDDSSLTTGVFTAAVTGLSPSTAYSYVGFVATSSGTSYTTVDTFTTSAVLSSIVVTPANPSISRGATQQFAATGYYSDTSSQNLTGLVTWSSATTANATIDSAGLATGAGVGTSTITATSGSVSGSTTLTVTAPTITLSPTTLTAATVASATSQTITASGGTATYSYAVTAGALPAGLTLATNGALSGTPTAAGTFNFTITATDSSTGTSAPFTGSRAYSLTVSAPTITLSPTSLTNPAVGSPTSQTLTASGGTATYTYAVTAGALPAGLTLSSSGSLTGTATAAGTFNFTVTATDSSTGTGAPFTGSRAYSLTVSAPTITLSPTTLTAATVASGTSQTLTASGGTAGYTYAVTAGALPAGVTLSTGGALSGTPTAGGTFNFTVTATDSSTGSGPFTGSRAYSLTVSAPTITLSPTTLTAATVASATSQAITASGGTATYTYAITAGALPAGLTLATNGTLAGTPTAGGTYNFTVTATDFSTGSGPFTGSRAYSLTVNAPTITLSPSTLTAASIATATSQTITASGGTAGYTYAVTAGSLPPGLSLSTDGTITGTATGGGTYNFTVTATDSSTGSGPFTGSRAYALTVNAPTITLSPTTLTAVTVASATSQTITASGGTAGYTYAITAGALPSGLTLATGGTISGTPTAGGVFNFTVTATDSSTGSGPFTGSRAYALTVNPPTITLAPTTLTAATVASATSQTITASGGTATYTYAITAGALPAGVSLATDGTLSGTPTAGGTFNFTVTATDSSTGFGPFVGTQTYSLMVNVPVISLAPSTALPDSIIDRTYTHSVTALGGTAPYTFAVTAGALPPGLTLDSSGQVSGTPTASGTFSFAITATDSSTGTGPYSGARIYSIIISTVPTVTSPTSADATGNSATLGGEVSSDGSSAVTARGIVLSVTSVNAEPRLGGTGVIDVPAAGTTGVFTVPAGGFVLNTTYSYAAYATNAVGTSYSATGTFTTASTGSLRDNSPADFDTGITDGLSTTESPGDLVLATSTEPDQENTTIGSGSTGISTSIWGGQSFTPSTSGFLTSIQLNLFATGVTGTTPDITVSIRAVDVNGLPTGADLATATIAGFSSSTPADHTAEFTQPVMVTAGVQYAFLVRPVSNPSAGSYNLSRSGTSNTGDDVYPGGVRLQGPASGTIWAVVLTPAGTGTTTDLVFKVYVDRNSGTFTSSVKDSHLPDGTTHWTTLAWSADTPEGTSLKFQVAASDNSDGPFTFVGPDGTASTYFTESGANLIQFYGHRYLQYRAFLATSDAFVTPVLHDVTLGYDLVAPPALTATAATDVTGISVTLGGNVTFDGGGIISARGIVLSPTATNANPTLDGQGVIVLPASTNGTGAYTVAATELTRGTDYSYAAYATNQGGTSYSPVATFTTVAVPIITNDPLATDGTYGTAFDPYSIVATSSPTSYTADGLPAGLSLNADTGVISGTPTATGSFNVAVSATNIAGTANATFVITIAKARLTVTADAKSKVYGAANPAATATISGFVHGETLATSDVTGTPALVVNADATTAVGSATIVPSLGTLASNHYSFTFANGALSITKYALTVTADPKVRIYGAANPSLTYTISGFLNGQNLGTSGVTGAAVVTTTAVPTTPIGAATITVAAGTLSAANYSFSLVNGTLTINRATLTVTAEPKQRTYGAADPAFAATITGYVNGETASVVSGTPSYTTNATATSPIGQYVITPAVGTLSAANYAFSFATGALTISPATLTLSVNAATKPYGSDNPVLTAKYLGFLNGETDTVVTGAPVLSTTAVKSSPVGNYPITVTAGTLAAANYVFNTTSVLSSNQLTVTKAPLTVRVTDQARAYGAANATPVVTYAGFVLEETASVLSGAPVATHTATVASPAGAYTIALGAGTLAATNYSFTLVPGTLTVNQAALTVTADAKSKTYGAANPALTVTISGFANGENLATSGITGAAAVTTTATTSSDIGTYPITAAVGTLAAPNYRFGTFNDGVLTVTAASLGVTLDGLSRTYDGQPKSVTVTTTPSGVATTVLYAGSATPPTDAGSYAVTATPTSANYTGSAQGTLVIAQAAQTVTFPVPASVTVNAPITLTATASSGLPVTFSVVSGHATLAGSQLTVADNGAVVVRATQAGNGNYLSATKDITLSNVALASQTITFDQPASHTTAETSFALVATASSGLPVTFTYVSGPGAVSGNTVTLINTVGTVVVRASQAGNTSYSAAADVTRSITITAKSAQVFFGGFGSQGAKDVSATAVAIGGGLAASLTADGQNSTLIGYLPTSGDGFVLKFNLAADGTFSATTTSIPNPTAASPVEVRGPGTRSAAAMALAAATLTFHGQVAGGILSGVIDELSLPFSAEIQPDTGTTAALAGFYQAAPLNSASGNIYSVVSANGGAFVLAITPAYVGGGSGSVNNTGSFTISTPQSGVVTGSVDAASTSVTGTLTLPSQPAQDFAGLGNGTTRTDRLVNLSSRALITPNSGDSTLITGFVIGGASPKQVLLRGVGPALAGYGVQNPAAAPQLRVFDSAGHLVGQNSGWNNDATLATLAGNLGASPFAANSKDAAVALTLAPGAYSMHVFTTGTAGVALAEIFDADNTPAYQRLLNISTRGPVSSGEGVLIAGFVVTGNSPKRVLIRGAGPGLAQQGVSGVLADPVVRLYDHTGTVIARNDNWETPVTVGSGQTAATAADITAANAQIGAFAFATGSKDAALIVVLAPGVYSAQVGSATAASGNALVEVYELP